MLRLLERPRGDGITFGTSQTPGQPRPNVVKPGASVTLRDGKADVHVRVTEVEGGKFIGVIEEFAGHNGPTYEGHRLGDPITFSESNVFICVQ